MPSVQHNVKDPRLTGQSSPPPHHGGGPSHAGVTHSIQGKGTNLFTLLSFIKEKEPVTCEQVGHFLGVSHKDQAIKRGSQRMRTLLDDKLVSRGAQKVVNSRENHATYTITDKGEATLAAGFVKVI